MDKMKESSVVVAENKHISAFAHLLRGIDKISGAKRAFGLPEDEIAKVIEKQNRNRGVFTPTDRKAYYETIHVNGFPCLIVRENEQPSECANVPYTAFARPKMVNCYCMLPYFKEAREDFAKITEILKK